MSTLRDQVALQAGEVFLQEEAGRISAGFSLDFSQSAPGGKSNPPLQAQKLSAFLKSSERGLFVLLKRGDQQLGKASIFLSQKNPKEAYLGCFETSGEERVVHLVLQAAIQWSKEQGVRRVYGPIDKNTWYTYRFRRDQDPLSFAWEPPRQDAVYESWKKFGFRVSTHYNTFAYRRFLLANMRLVSYLFYLPARRAQKLGYRIEPFNPDWKQNLERVYRIAQSAFDTTFLYEKISFEDFVALYAPFASRIDFRPSFFLVEPKGEAIGFILSFYEGEYLVVKSMGLMSSYHGSGLGRSLAYATLKAAAADGFQSGITALIRAGNRTALMSELIKKVGVHAWTHEYELLAYEIYPAD